jgi:carbon monoxide dehydrogenase subunit G
MQQGRNEFRVERPVSVVFAFVADVERAPEWVPDLLSVEKLTSGPIGVGTKYSEEVNQGGRAGKAELTVTRYEVDRLVVTEGHGGPATFTASYTFEPDGDATNVVHDYTLELSGIARLMAPMIHSWLEKNNQTAVENLKRILETARE